MPRALPSWFLVPSLLLGLVLGLSACRTHRYLEISSDPPGAEVRLDDESVGVTPLSIPFEHYGTRRLTFYLAGYRTSSRRIRLRAPWYGRFPLDLVSEVLLPLGFTDRRKVHQELIQGEEVMGLPSLRSVIERARALRESGPEGPRDLPDISPAVVPIAPAPPSADEPKEEPQEDPAAEPRAERRAP